MATPTSSSNRSKRKGTKPITQGQNPQRGNRQKVSNAQVTNSSTRGSNTGSAKVTTGRGANAPKPADPWKASTTKNSRTSAPKSNTTFRTQNTPLTLPNSRAQGKNLPRAGAQQLRSTTQGPRPSGKPSVKPSGNFKAPSIPNPTAAAPKPSAKPSVRGAGGLLGKALVPLAMAGEVSAMMDRDRRWNDYKERNYGNTRVKPKQGNAQSRFAGARQANLNRINNDPRFTAPAEKPKPPAPRASDSRPSQTTPSSRTASGSGTQRSTASRPSPTSTPRTAATATTGSRSQPARPAEKQPSMGREVFDRSGKGSLGPNYGIDQFGDKNGIDMERRRTFLDAKDSQEGRKAINKLMEERRKKQRQSDSTSK